MSALQKSLNNQPVNVIIVGLSDHASSGNVFFFVVVFLGGCDKSKQRNKLKLLVKAWVDGWKVLDTFCRSWCGDSNLAVKEPIKL